MARTQWPPIAVVVLALALTVGACSGGDSRQGFLIDARNFRFDPSQASVSAGQVTLSVSNKDKVAHNLSVPSIPVDVDVPAGVTKSVIFVLPDSPGPVEFFCKFHRDRGMTGTFTRQ